MLKELLTKIVTIILLIGKKKRHVFHVWDLCFINGNLKCLKLVICSPLAKSCPRIQIASYLSWKNAEGLKQYSKLRKAVQLIKLITVQLLTSGDL